MFTAKPYSEAVDYLVTMLREAKASGDSELIIATVMAAACYTVAHIYGANPVSLSMQVYNREERGH